MYGNYGGAIAVIAIGAILKYAVSGTLTGISIATIGVILMIAGAAWLIIALAFDLSARRRYAAAAPAEHDYAAGPPAQRERVVERDPAMY
jgi:hypothetical protein